MSKFACPGPAKTEEDATKKSYQFWSTQPVPAIDEVVTTNEFISDDVPTSEVRQEPYSLPDGFKWDTRPAGHRASSLERGLCSSE